MSGFRAFAIGSCLGILGLAFLPAQADEWNKKTMLTVNEPVALPTTVLQPGKYVIKLMDSQSNRHIVQVFDEGEQNLVTTILAIPNYRLRPTDDTQFGFWETSAAGQPRALKAWFYPGDNFGQEFAYPKDMAALIAKANNANVPAIMNEESDVSKAEVATMTPSGQAAETEQQAQVTTQPETSTTTTTPSMAESTTAQSHAGEATKQNQQATTPAPSTPAPSSAETAAAPQPQPNTGTPSELPRTASPAPLMGLAGLAFAAAASAVRAKRSR